MPRVVSIQFNTAGKMYDFNAGDFELKPGTKVVVDTEKGASIGTVVTEPLEKDESTLNYPLAIIRRIIQPEDELKILQNTEREKEARDFCLRRIKERNMEMKLVRVEYLFDGSKAIFFFTADGRVDFRELVKDLAHNFHTRIEMRQIGVRDEAKMVGGLGICGRELCCASFLRDFQPVSVKMAKEQNLALNPTKISGQCGRLLCCLDYEYEAYCDLRKNFPKCGKKACTSESKGIVEKMNLLTGEITLRQDDGKLVSVNIKDLADENSHVASQAVSEQATIPIKQQCKIMEPEYPEPVLYVTEHDKKPEQAQLPASDKKEADEENQKQKKKKRNRRHGHRKNRDQKNDSASEDIAS